MGTITPCASESRAPEARTVALTGSSGNNSDIFDAADVRELRAYLRAGMNRSGRSARLAEAVRVKVEACMPIEEIGARCADAIRGLVRRGAISSAEGEAWLSLGGLRAEMRTKAALAESVGLKSVRGLDGRMTKIDGLVAEAIGSGSDAPPINGDATNLILTAAHLDELGEVDAADGYLQAAAAASMEGRLALPFRGKDRTKRRRARLRATEEQKRGVISLTASPIFDNLHDATQIARSTDPHLILSELNDAWTHQDVNRYPDLMRDALSSIPDFATAGASCRLQLLELVANILRDSETFSTLLWARQWGAEVTRHNPHDIRAVKARRTLAHGLQVFGFWPAAILHLERAIHQLKANFEHHPEYSIELGDLQHRLLSARLSAGLAAKPEDLRRTLRDLERAPGPAGLERDRLHVESVVAARIRAEGARGRTFRYEEALEAAINKLATEQGSAYFGMIDAVLHSAHRVGDYSTISMVSTTYDVCAPAPWANLGFRIENRLLLAQRQSQTLPHPAEVGAVQLVHPLRKGRTANVLASAI